VAVKTSSVSQCGRVMGNDERYQLMPDIYISPSKRLYVEGKDLEKYQGLLAAFSKGPGHGLLFLGNSGDTTLNSLTHSATSPNACHWGVRAESPKGLNGLSLSVSTLRIPIR